MNIVLVNPSWDFSGSIYFGCREPHLPLEFGYARALLEADGHRVSLVDGQLDGLSDEQIVGAVAAFNPDMIVLTTAPSYLFWRCAPPELRVPLRLARQLRPIGGALVAVGPHGSSTPETTLRKLAVDLVVMGECEEVLVAVASALRADPASLPSDLVGVSSICVKRDGVPVRQGSTAAANMGTLPALRWPEAMIARHAHHHHRFDVPPRGPGAEMEVSRGCPYRCTFCAKENFRNKYRKRPLAVILDELEGLLRAGVQYVYFIDEIFLPDRALLEALVARREDLSLPGHGFSFGVQTRIDLWDEVDLALLGRAGCVSIEAGIESITTEGRQLLDKRCKLDTDQLAGLLIEAKRHVPFVQANLLEAGTDDPAAIDAWRQHLIAHGVWANKPVPLFPYPGSPDYTRLWGKPDEMAWERAHAHYLAQFHEFSDIQDDAPIALPDLERVPDAVPV
jgi:anaerobic magnesium-protoporphyrin IX monomethyl ester cyclase